MTRNHSQVSRPLPEIGVGAMPFSLPGADVSRATEVWHRAFDLGLTLINTADAYAPSPEEYGHNERLVGEAIRAYGREQIVVVTKVGHTRGNPDWGRNNTADYLLPAAEGCSARLGFVPDAILLHRRDRSVPLAHAVEAMMEIKSRGLAHHVGFSNIHRYELDEAWELSGGGISFVENERSPRYRDDADVLERCDELGIAYLAWSPLGGGQDAARLGEFFPAFAEVGEVHDATAQEVALAWLLAQANAMVPIPAFTRESTAESTATAAFLQLDDEDLAYLNASAPGPGSLYPD